MKAIITVASWASDLVTTVWTPAFFALFLGVVLYAVWPSNKASFDAAARMPLRED
jgi:cytochrome c oxidase cbb3-type subunit IV